MQDENAIGAEGEAQEQAKIDIEAMKEGLVAIRDLAQAIASSGAEPADPADSDDPDEPAEPAEPADPDEPGEAAGPADPDGHGEPAVPSESAAPAPGRPKHLRPVDGLDAGDSGHIADVIAEGGEAIDGALVWSASSDSFRLVDQDGAVVSNLDAEEAMEFLEAKRLAFDGAHQHQMFVSKMGEAGMDADRDHFDLSPAGSTTGELLVMQDDLLGTGRHGGGGDWPDEVGMGDGGGDAGRGRWLWSRDFDMAITAIAVASVAAFYIAAAILWQLPPAVMAALSIFCVAVATLLLVPMTLGPRRRAMTAGVRGVLSMIVAATFILMLGCVLGNAGMVRFPGGEQQDDGAGQGMPMELDLMKAGDVASLAITGVDRAFPAVVVDGLYVVAGDVGDASSLTLVVNGKSYAAQRVATIDGLGVTVLAADGDGPAADIPVAKSLSMGEKVVTISAKGDGTLYAESAVIRRTSLPMGASGGVDAFSVDRELPDGTIILDDDGCLIGMVASRDEAITGMAVAKALAILADEGDADKPYIGVVCRDAMSTESASGGAYVESVISGSPAANAGVMTGDIIVKVDDYDVEGVRDLDDLIGGRGIGEQARLVVERAGEGRKSLTVAVTRHGEAQLVVDGA